MLGIQKPQICIFSILSMAILSLILKLSSSHDWEMFHNTARSLLFARVMDPRPVPFHGSRKQKSRNQTMGSMELSKFHGSLLLLWESILPTLIWSQSKIFCVGFLPSSSGRRRFYGFITETCHFQHQRGYAFSLDLSNLIKRDLFWIWDPGICDCVFTAWGMELWMLTVMSFDESRFRDMLSGYAIRIFSSGIGKFRVNNDFPDRLICIWDRFKREARSLFINMTLIRTNWYQIVDISELSTKALGFVIRRAIWCFYKEKIATHNFRIRRSITKEENNGTNDTLASKTLKKTSSNSLISLYHLQYMAHILLM